MSEQDQIQKVEVLEVDTQALAVTTNSEIDMQITTAKKFPRSITNFKRKAYEMATIDENTARSMFYVLPARGGNAPIEGPSIRLAEIVGSAWTNLRYGARVTEIGKKQITAEGMAYDLETNTACSIQVRRRITTKKGQRYSEDMIAVTANAACAVALRNAIFKVVPFQYVKDVYLQAKKASLGEGTFSEQKQKTFESFKAAYGLKQLQVCEIVGLKGPDDLTIDHIIQLRGIFTALEQNETTVEQLLNPDAKPTASINEKLSQTRNNEPEKESPLPESATEPKKVPDASETKTESEENKAEVDEQVKTLRARVTQYQVEFGKIRNLKSFNEVMEKNGAGQSVSKLDAKALTILINELESAYSKSQSDIAGDNPQ